MIYLSRTAGIPLRYVNRHGLITGATGSGKTVSLMRLAEQLSRAGVPSFVPDVKGDLSALVRSCPVAFLDPIQTTFSALGPDLLSRALELSDAQSGAVDIAFAYASRSGWRLDTLTDLRRLLAQLVADRVTISAEIGQVTSASVGVVQRALLRLEMDGAERLFQAPPYDVAELLKPALVTILMAERLIQSPRLYSAILLWIMSDLYRQLPEVGDLDQPRLVLFFDETHLLFADCPPALLRRIEQIVRLIRSKGVGLFFVTQSPADIPQVISDQLAHRIEHDRAYGVGRARLSTLRPDGSPAAPVIVQVELPDCPLGLLSDSERPNPVSAAVQTQTASTWHALAGLALIALAITVVALVAWQWPRSAGAILVGLALASWREIWMAFRRNSI